MIQNVPIRKLASKRTRKSANGRRGKICIRNEIAEIQIGRQNEKRCVLYQPPTLIPNRPRYRMVWHGLVWLKPPQSLFTTKYIIEWSPLLIRLVTAPSTHFITSNMQFFVLHISISVIYKPFELRVTGF